MPSKRAVARLVKRVAVVLDGMGVPREIDGLVAHPHARLAWLAADDERRAAGLRLIEGLLARSTASLSPSTRPDGDRFVDCIDDFARRFTYRS